jgi:ornithine carbamoyltransferase
MKSLLRIADLSLTELTLLLDTAAKVQRDPHHFAHLLAGDSVVLHFAKPSTRTRVSFETAVARLGGAAITTGPTELQLGRGETIEDTARVISRYARAFVIRTFADDDVRRFADAATIPVVNALTDGHHPCQALADLLTLQQRFGRLHGLKLAYVGDGNNVAHSLLEACALAGVDIAVATPPGFEPDPEVVAVASQLADRSGSAILETHDPLLAASDADAVYTDVWVSMGDADEERRREALQPYHVDAGLMQVASPSAIFMHCLPAHRGQEVSASVLDGPRSVVFDQAENRLHTAVAVLALLVALGGRDLDASVEQLDRLGLAFAGTR